MRRRVTSQVIARASRAEAGGAVPAEEWVERAMDSLAEQVKLVDGLELVEECEFVDGLELVEECEFVDGLELVEECEFVDGLELVEECESVHEPGLEAESWSECVMSGPDWDDSPLLSARDTLGIHDLSDHFAPHPLLAHPVAQMLAAALWTWEREAVPGVRHLFPLGDGDALVGFEDVPDPAHDRGASVVIFHSLGSSAHDPQIRHTSAILTRVGYRCFRIDHRGIGGSNRSARFYHPGRSRDIGDVLSAIAEQRPAGEKIVAISYSISANMLLSHLGRAALGYEPPPPRNVVGGVVISPVVDIGAAIDALDTVAFGTLGRFIAANTKKQLEKRHALLPELGPTGIPSSPRVRDLLEFAARFTPEYDGPDDLCHRSSAMHWISSICVPLYAISAADDPLVQCGPRPWREHPSIYCVEPKRGGHLGFISATPGESGHRRWLDHALLSMMRRLTAESVAGMPTRPSLIPEIG